MAATGQLSEKEIWDDSVLQNSWNEALEEYNHYHSIHARGEEVEEVLEKFENANGVVNENTENAGEDMVLDGHDEDAVAVEEKEAEFVAPRAGSASNTQENEKDSTSSMRSPPGMPPLPENLIGAVDDEDLKRLLMSWYYSGYYTGFFEGKRNAARQANPTG